MNVSSDVAPTAAPGWFGKLSCLGDFASRRLPSDFTRCCDEWVSRGLASSRAQLGSRWLDVYLGAPVWRFAWAPGIVDAQWWLGALMPSVDKVGRYFPLVVACDGASPPLEPGPRPLQDWFDEIVGAMLTTLDGSASVEAFDERLLAIPQWTQPLVSEMPAVDRLAGRIRCELPSGGGPAWPKLTLAHHLECLRGHCLWWPLCTRADTPSSLSVSRGLPPAEHFVDLLEVTW